MRSFQDAFDSFMQVHEKAFGMILLSASWPTEPPKLPMGPDAPLPRPPAKSPEATGSSTPFASPRCVVGNSTVQPVMNVSPSNASRPFTLS